MKAYIQPNMITWARMRADYSVADLADRLHVKQEKLVEWEAGQTVPTLRQAQSLARLFHIPFGWLYLTEPPKEDIMIPDLRTIGRDQPSTLSTDFCDQLNEVLYKQHQFVELIKEEGAEPLPFVGKFSTADDPVEVVADIRQALHIDDEMRKNARNGEDFLRLFIAQAEDLGILVMRSGIVGNNTHRPLSVDEFRGFAISDPYAPLVFINGQDAKAAQIFTLAHELAHIWLGSSGISNPKMNKGRVRQQKVEDRCNKIAAELLVPAEALRREWSKGRSLDENIRKATLRFRVSSLVTLYRARNLRLIGQEEFVEHYRTELARHQRPSRPGKGGPPPGLVIPTRNSHLLVETILSATYEGRLLFRDACRILGAKTATIQKLAIEAGVA